MSRVRRGYKARRRRKKVLKAAKGFRGSRRKIFKHAHESVMKALKYAYRDRRNRKRDFRALWITRIGIAAKAEGTSYSKLMGGLKKKGVELDRKVLADIAVRDPKTFSEIVKVALG